MTTYWQPNRRQRDRRWDYTRTDADGTFAVGYCAGWVEPNAGALLVRLGAAHAAAVVAGVDALRPARAAFHRDGHATAAEAEECWRRYVLQHRTRVEPDDDEAEERHRCAAPGCAEFTSGALLLDFGVRRRLALCALHRTPEVAEELTRRR